MKDDAVLAIQAVNEPAGKLLRAPGRQNACVFSYDAVPAERAVSLTMAVSPVPSVWDSGLHPIFQMNLPEGDLRAALIRRFAKAAPRFDDFSLLGIVGPHQLGRVSVAADGGGAMPGVDLQALAVYEGAEDLAAYLIEEFARYSGVSGVQPKTLVRDQGSSATGDGRLTHKGATHIVKSWSREQFPCLAANEYFCLRAARAAGLDVPHASLSANGQLLMVERFDIDVNGNYLGFEDFCVLQGWAAARRYEGTYEGCARIIKAYVTPEHIPRAMSQLFTGVVLSCAVRNGDQHMKNFGVLYRSPLPGAEVVLAPSYDIVATTPYLPRDTLALLMGGSKRWPDARRLRAFGRHCDLSAERVSAVMEAVPDALSDTRHEVLAYMRDTPLFRDAIGERFLTAWDEGQSSMQG